MRIFIEFTDAFERPEWNTGVQRVRRNIVSCVSAMNDDSVIPILFKKGKIYDGSNVASGNKMRWKESKILHFLDLIGQRIWLCYGNLIRLPFINSSSLVKRILWIIFKISCQPVATPMRIIRFLRWKKAVRLCDAIEVKKNDIFVWLGSPVSKNDIDTLSAMKQEGLEIISVIYDLCGFDVTPPQIGARLPEMMDIADGYMAISRTVRDELHKCIKAYKGTSTTKECWFDYFYFGSDLDMVDKKYSTLPEVISLFQGKRPVYLMVGTPGRRKNQSYVLDIFERLWNDGGNIALCIVGRVGTDSADMVRRIHQHQEWGRRLFMLTDANDNDLEYCYKNARALVFPSLCEGFGLPLIEAMQCGLPVMASDIPIFREIGSDFVAYFSLDNPKVLYDLIVSNENKGIFPAKEPVTNWRWITWEESAQQLVERVRRHV